MYTTVMCVREGRARVLNGTEGDTKPYARPCESETIGQYRKDGPDFESYSRTSFQIRSIGDLNMHAMKLSKSTQLDGEERSLCFHVI